MKRRRTPHCPSHQQLTTTSLDGASSQLTVAMKRTSGHCPAAADDDDDDSIKPIDGTTRRLTVFYPFFFLLLPLSLPLPLLRHSNNSIRQMQMDSADDVALL